MSDYNIWILEYAQLPNYPDSALMDGAAEGARLLPFYYFVLRQGDRVALVDCGGNDSEFTRDMVDSYGFRAYSTPDKILPRIGLRTDDIRDIIVTHHHWDHIGGLDYFPHSQVWIQQREIDNWMAKWCSPPRLKRLAYGLDPDTSAALARAGGDGRLRALHGVTVVLPGVEVRPAYDTHTAGSQYVVIDNAEGAPWVLPGDVACVYENVGGLEGTEPLIPVGLAHGSQERCIRSADEMLTAARDDVRRVLPMHDDRIFERFPTTRYEDGLRVCRVE
ncbi:MBL fold metallo-hydrolase [Qaidamihabitans albus]|uniref:MBL fold metallo-hydrolase n=1 Tax=Qaidamihabitans albus TaxID=2795733 RepID=UPI0018F1361F|nr:MBL fold metallo-hydrolase [Qaidamihabitans albus]